MNTATLPARKWHPAGEVRYLPHRSRNYRRRRRLTRKKDGKKTGSFTLPVLTAMKPARCVGPPSGRGSSAVAAERGEARNEDVGEQAGVAAVRVEVRVEDGHLGADRTRGDGG
jgi:hypothetical protein